MMKTFEHIDFIEKLRESDRQAIISGDGIHICDISCPPRLGFPFKTNWYGCFICLSGEASGSIDLMPYRLAPSTMVVNVPGQLLEQQATSPDFHGTYIVMDSDFINRLALPYNFKLDRMLREQPVMPLQPKQLEAMLAYRDMVCRLLEDERPFRTETMRHLTCAFYYGIGSYLYQLSESRRYTTEETLMQNFLAEINVHYRSERKLSFYADRLHVSAGHLSAVVKHASGKSAGDWIDDYVVGEARAMLKGTSLTIQQISQELGFPSQSFFGKYFKRETGMSPKTYREN